MTSALVAAAIITFIVGGSGTTQGSTESCIADPARPAAVHLCRANRDLANFKPELRNEIEHQRLIENAIRELKRAAELGRATPDYQTALRMLIDLHSPLYLNDLAIAEPILQHLREADPANVDVALELAAVREAAGLEDQTEPAAKLARYRLKWSDPAQFARGGSAPMPRLIKYVAPIAPAAASQPGARGVVIVEARIDETGAVASARIAESIPALDHAALAAVRQWRFMVTTVRGKPAAIIARIPVTFVP